MSRFAHIAEQIFEELDNYHFIQCKVISPTWKNFMEENKFSYIKYIKTLTNCSKKAIKTNFPQANLEDMIRLALDVSKIYDELRKANVTDPLLTLFHLAAKHGHLSICQLIIDGIEDMHPKDINERYPLHLAAENGHFSICQLIMDKNDSKFPQVDCPQNFDDVFNIDFQHNTPIHMAAQNGHLAVCEQLIKWIENVYPTEIGYANAANLDGNTPLHLAASFGHLSVCEFLVVKVERTNDENCDGATPIICALGSGHSAIFHLIFESIVDKRHINNSDNYGMTPLHYAVLNNLPSVCQKIMEIDGLDEDNQALVEDFDGITPFHLAARSGYLDICELFIVGNPTNIGTQIMDLDFLDFGYLKHPFYWAAAEGLMDVCKMFIQELEKKNPTDYDGYSLLHWAASNGHLEMCQYIIENVDDKNPVNQNFDTPLHLAAQRGNLEVCQLFVNNITDTSPENSIGETPMELASDSGHSTIVKMLQDSLLKKIKLG